MEITEAYQLSEWVSEEIEEAGILARYDALIAILNANVRRQNNQPVQPFENEKQALIDGITSVNLNKLSMSQLKLLEVLSIRENIGGLGKKKIESLLVDTLDIADIHTKIGEMRSEIQNGVTKSTELNSVLESFVDGELEEISADQVLTRVTFEDEASVKNIQDMKSWTSKWFDIGRGFAIANGQTPEDIQVVGGGRGSLIIEFAILATTAMPIAKAINLILDGMIKYKEFQIKAIEARKLKDETPKFEEDFEEDAKRWESRAQLLKDEMSDEVAQEIKQYFPNFQEDNQAEYDKAIKTLVDFISKGGDVDCVITDTEDDEAEPNEVTEALESLRTDFAKIRSRRETLLLEHQADEEQ